MAYKTNQPQPAGVASATPDHPPQPSESAARAMAVLRRNKKKTDTQSRRKP